MKNKSFIVLIIILLVAAFLRLYRISDYMVFLGDEGRDALVVKGILEGNLTLLGPRASAGDFFTGPIYYYMMAPFLWLFKLDPVGPAIMVALFGIATVFLVYWVGKKFFNTKTGLFASALYAISPLVLTYSRSSWNPNTVPFFSLLTIYMLFKAATTVRSWKYFLLTGLLLGICLQLHYISLFLALIVAIALFIMHWYLNGKLKLLPLLSNYLQIFIGFLIGFSPFLAFEIRHNFMNIKTIFAFISTDTVNKGYATYNAFYEPIADVFFRIFARLLFNFPIPIDYHKYSLISLQLFGLLIIIIAIAAIIVLMKHKNKFVVILLSVWLFTGILLFGLYKKPIFDYYLVFIFPLPFLLLGNLLSRISDLSKKKLPYGIFVGGIFFAIICIQNFKGLPFWQGPNMQKDQVINIVKFVIDKSENKPFNFALIAPGNSDHGYRYYFEVLGHKPTGLQNQIEDPNRQSVTDQLLIVCEDPNCEPLGYRSYEVAGFGRASIVDSWNISVVKVYKLGHYRN